MNGKWRGNKQYNINKEEKNIKERTQWDKYMFNGGSHDTWRYLR